MQGESTPVEQPAPRPTNPVALAVTAVAALGVCTVVGWALRGLGSRAPSRPALAVPVAVAAPSPHERGRLVFQVHCARCHGPSGRGDGPDAASLHPPPRNLTAGPWRTPASEESVRRTVREGIPGTMMPGLAAALGPRELDAVVDFVRSLAPDEARISLINRLDAAGFSPVPAAPSMGDLELLDSHGHAVPAAQWRNKLLLVVFWGTSCAPCVKELPALQRWAERRRATDFQVVPVCADETDPEVVRAVAGERAPGLPVYIDATGAAKRSFDVQALPSAALVAPDGRLLGRAQGSLDWSSRALDTLIDAKLPARSELPGRAAE